MSEKESMFIFPSVVWADWRADTNDCYRLYAQNQSNPDVIVEVKSEEELKELIRSQEARYMFAVLTSAQLPDAQVLEERVW